MGAPRDRIDRAIDVLARSVLHLPGIAGAVAVSTGVGLVTHGLGPALITAGGFALLIDRRL